jgi:hypothetical protein
VKTFDGQGVPFHLRIETDPVSETLCSFQNTRDNGQSPEIQ